MGGHQQGTELAKESSLLRSFRTHQGFQRPPVYPERAPSILIDSVLQKETGTKRGLYMEKGPSYLCTPCKTQDNTHPPRELALVGVQMSFTCEEENLRGRISNVSQANRRCSRKRTDVLRQERGKIDAPRLLRYSIQDVEGSVASSRPSFCANPSLCCKPIWAPQGSRVQISAYQGVEPILQDSCRASRSGSRNRWRALSASTTDMI